MTLTIQLTPETEARLKREAAQRGLTLPDYARSVLEGGPAEPPTQQRVFGSHRGKIRISEDFDAELPDEFWFSGQ